MTKKQIKTVGEALVIIKELQDICKKQREEITRLKQKGILHTEGYNNLKGQYKKDFFDKIIKKEND